MGGKSSAPAAPDYGAQIMMSKEAAASDARAAEMQYDLGKRQLEQQERFGAASGQRADELFQMAKDADQWGKDQFNLVWPYAKDYMSSQQTLSKLAGENASEAVIAARQNREQSLETYNRYMGTFAPIENEFAQKAREYGSPARADQASAAAQADVSQAYGAQATAREAQLKSYGIDPSQARYQGESALAGLSQAGAQAAAGTQARRAQELAGMGLMGQAVEIGQKLPSQAIQQIAAATQGATSGISAGGAGGSGIGQATSLYGQAAQPRGTGYASGANPYTQLSGSAGTMAANLYGGGTTALGNQTGAIRAGSEAMNFGFSNTLDSYKAQQAADQSMWGGIGKIVGGIGSLALAPVTGGGSLFGNFMSSDRALKDDIKEVGHVGALPLYTFRYKGDDKQRIGYMADDVERVDPGAVAMTTRGYKAVDYARATVSALGA